MSDFPSFATGIGFLLASYLVGSIPFAVVVSKLMRLDDPRNYGSGNPGATNVLRTGNKLAAALTLLGDLFKGWLMVILALRFGPGLGLDAGWIAGCAVAVFLGHLYPLFLGFKGGKGVATAMGVLLALHPLLALAALVTWLLVAYFTRYSSLAALLAAACAPIYYLLGAGIAWPADGRIGTAIGIISLMLIYRHKANISRLLQGTEGKIGGKKKNAGQQAGTAGKQQTRHR